MHRKLERPVRKATCLYTNLYLVYINLYRIIQDTSAFRVIRYSVVLLNFLTESIKFQWPRQEGPRARAASLFYLTMAIQTGSAL